jgi:FixJ family two-component response regulator
MPGVDMAEASSDVSVIDDDEPVRKSLQRLLRSAGLRVDIFASAEEYLHAEPPQHPGCLLLDVRMPGTSGLDLQEQLQAAGCTTPIIFMTAHEDGRARSRAFAAGAVAFLQKPVDDKALLEAIYRVLGRVC